VSDKPERIERTVVTQLVAGTRFTAPRGDINFNDVQARSVDFSSQSFDGFRTNGGVFEDCDFGNVRFGRRWVAVPSVLSQTVFRRCRFDGADLRHFNVGQSRFEECSFRKARIDKWFSFMAEFIDCTFEGKLNECTFYGIPSGFGLDRLNPLRERNEFRGNDFSRAELTWCAFRHEIDIDAQRWPSGERYLILRGIKERILRTRAGIAVLGDRETIAQGLTYLRQLEETYERQRDVLLEVRDDPIERKVVELLRAA
jgi:hypothetical protein